MNDRHLIVSDVDGTLLGCDRALDDFATWFAARREQFYLVYNSGRLTDSIRESVLSSSLPEPDALVGGVGTEIEFFSSREKLADWPQLQGNWDSNIICDTLKDCAGLNLQPPEAITSHKISYFAYGATESDLENWRSLLKQAGQAVQLIYSSARDLDLVPAGINKGAAAARLAGYWKMPSERVIVCGDSGNDGCMFNRGFRGVVVGNALPELKSLRGPNIFHAAHHFAAGVEEGIRFWLGE